MKKSTIIPKQEYVALEVDWWEQPCRCSNCAQRDYYFALANGIKPIVPKPITK